MNALADPQVGTFVNENFASSFQKVATFQIVNGRKQGGNVAAYFCAPDGRVLHIIAGPVDAKTFLREAQWVVATVKTAMKTADGNGGKFKAEMRRAHAAKLRDASGLVVEPVTFDPPEPQDEKDALTYRDPTGNSLAPRLPPPPIDGPDVRLEAAEFQRRQANEAKAAGAAPMKDGRGRPMVIGNQSRVHQILAGHAMVKIERIYGTIFESILGERISTRPVEVKSPFSWMDKAGNRITVPK